MRAWLVAALVVTAGHAAAAQDTTLKHQVVGRWETYTPNPTDAVRGDSLLLDIKPGGQLVMTIRRFDGRKGGWQPERFVRTGKWWLEQVAPGNGTRPRFCHRTGKMREPACGPAYIMPARLTGDRAMLDIGAQTLFAVQ